MVTPKLANTWQVMNTSASFRRRTSLEIVLDSWSALKHGGSIPTANNKQPRFLPVPISQQQHHSLTAGHHKPCHQRASWIMIMGLVNTWQASASLQRQRMLPAQKYGRRHPNASGHHEEARHQCKNWSSIKPMTGCTAKAVTSYAPTIRTRKSSIWRDQDQNSIECI